MSLFCRHGRFTADCAICSKGTVLEDTSRRRRPATGGGTRSSRSDKAPARAFSGPHVASPAYDDGDGGHYVVRLEKVPGGLRLAAWAGSELRRRAPVLAPADLAALAAGAGEALPEKEAARLAEALRTEPAREGGGPGISRGRAGDFKEELRVEALEDGRLRVARWVLRPGSGWELQDAPPMLPVARYAEALTDAVRQGLLAAAPASEHDGAVRL